jgi:hypothetical protein
MDESKLIEKLRLIESLFSGAATQGERVAAERARERILDRLKFWEKEDPPIEYRFSMGDMWSRKVFVTLLRRYGIRPYRYSRQRHTTVMAKVSKKFVDETLWPEFQEIAEMLRTYLSDVTDRVVSQVIHQDSSEAEVVDEPAQLPASTMPPPAEAEQRSEVSLRPSGREEHANAAASVEPSTDKSSKNRRKRNRKKKRKRR